MSDVMNGQSTTLFFDAQNAWQTWSLEAFETRAAVMQQVVNALVKEHATLVPVVQFHINHAEKYLGKVHQLVGPTGETNELYTVGRGVCALVAGGRSLASRQALMAQLTCALIAGNSVVVCIEDVAFGDAIEALLGAILPKHLLQFTDFEQYSTLCARDVRSVGCVVSSATLQEINRQLAERESAIATLTAETDLERLPTSHDPRLCLRFISERTRTINITAVGGNATLLELGSDSHG
ncbi:1-pyrroline-5-carboxylate dehydrogenase [Vibrio maerlii]|uniref:1-pyrroline-5-carboxylate dehydrogenase n=1 Tax=Vibrio maerlii TaxID=2231648 RepID=UPI001F12A230|nr:1-pyrroline-5-carboxylate dehydrogenase [Vibrio maerlii]